MLEEAELARAICLSFNNLGVHFKAKRQFNYAVKHLKTVIELEREMRSKN